VVCILQWFIYEQKDFLYGPGRHCGGDLKSADIYGIHTRKRRVLAAKKTKLYGPRPQIVGCLGRYRASKNARVTALGCESKPRFDADRARGTLFLFF